jgi:CDP-glucose 4,6-dehydratase
MKKKFLVTGGFGLTGVSLVNLLLKKNYSVVILDYKKKRQNYFLKNANLKIEKGNFCEKKFIEKIFKKYNFSGVFHLGAQTQVLKALQDPFETFLINVMGTINFLEVIRKSKKKIPFLYSSSDKAYGELEKKYYLEKDKLNAIFPYDTSKSSSDLICQSYSETYNIKVGIIRSANIFGPQDRNLKRIVPETIINLLNKKKIVIRSNGKLKRDYDYVDDTANAYIMTYERLEKTNKNLLIYNVGSRYNLSVIEMVKHIARILKIKKNFYVIKNNSKKEIKNQRLNFKKISRELNWKQKVSLTEGLEKTINWYKKNLSEFR